MITMPQKKWTEYYVKPKIFIVMCLVLLVLSIITTTTFQQTLDYL